MLNSCFTYSISRFADRIFFLFLVLRAKKAQNLWHLTRNLVFLIFTRKIVVILYGITRNPVLIFTRNFLYQIFDRFSIFFCWKIITRILFSTRSTYTNTSLVTNTVEVNFFVSLIEKKTKKQIVNTVVMSIVKAMLPHWYRTVFLWLYQVSASPYELLYIHIVCHFSIFCFK